MDKSSVRSNDEVSVEFFLFKWHRSIPQTSVFLSDSSSSPTIFRKSTNEMMTDFNSEMRSWKQCFQSVALQLNKATHVACLSMQHDLSVLMLLCRDMSLVQRHRD